MRTDVLEQEMRKQRTCKDKKQIQYKETCEAVLEKQSVYQEEIICIEEATHYSYLNEVHKYEAAFPNMRMIRRKERSGEDNSPHDYVQEHIYVPFYVCIHTHLFFNVHFPHFIISK